MANPLEAAGFIDSILVLEHQANTRHDQRMHVGARHLRQRMDASLASRNLRQQRGVRPRFVEVLDDWQRLRQAQPVVLQHRQHVLRVQPVEGAGE